MTPRARWILDLGAIVILAAGVAILVGRVQARSGAQPVDVAAVRALWPELIEVALDADPTTTRAVIVSDYGCPYGRALFRHLMQPGPPGSGPSTHATLLYATLGERGTAEWFDRARVCAESHASRAWVDQGLRRLWEDGLQDRIEARWAFLDSLESEWGLDAAACIDDQASGERLRAMRLMSKRLRIRTLPSVVTQDGIEEGLSASLAALGRAATGIAQRGSAHIP